MEIKEDIFALAFSIATTIRKASCTSLLRTSRHDGKPYTKAQLQKRKDAISKLEPWEGGALNQLQGWYRISHEATIWLNNHKVELKWLKDKPFVIRDLDIALRKDPTALPKTLVLELFPESEQEGLCADKGHGAFGSGLKSDRVELMVRGLENVGYQGDTIDFKARITTTGSRFDRSAPCEYGVYLTERNIPRWRGAVYKLPAHVKQVLVLADFRDAYNGKRTYPRSSDLTERAKHWAYAGLSRPDLVDVLKIICQGKKTVPSQKGRDKYADAIVREKSFVGDQAEEDELEDVDLDLYEWDSYSAYFSDYQQAFQA